MLRQFLPRFNRPFQEPAQCPAPAFQSLHRDLQRQQVLCFKNRRRVARDNTVRFQKRTLQRPLSLEHPGYAGVQVVILEGPGGRLSVQHDGRTNTGQEAPPTRDLSTRPQEPSQPLLSRFQVPARQRLRQALRNCSTPRLFQNMTNRLGG